MMMVSVSVAVSGCARITGDSYCDVASPLLFSSDTTIDYLLDKDRRFLTDVTSHNETIDRLCSGA